MDEPLRPSGAAGSSFMSVAQSKTSQLITQTETCWASYKCTCEVRGAREAHLLFGDRILDNEGCSTLCDLVREPHEKDNRIVVRSSMIFGTMRSLAGSNAENNDVTLPIAHAEFSVRERGV